MATTRLAQLIVSLKDDMSKGAKAAAAGLDGLRASADKLAGTRSFGGLEKSLDRSRTSIQAMARELASGTMGGAFSRNLEKLKVAPREFDRVRSSWRTLQDELARAPGGRKAASVLGAESTWRRQQLSELIASRGEIARLREESARPISLLRRGARFAAGAAFAGGAGYAAQRGARATAAAGGQALREDARDYLAGMTPEQTAKLREISDAQSGKFKSLTSTSLHNLYRETATTSLGMGGMEAIAPELAQGMTVLQSLKGKDAALGQLTGFMRALDTLGKNVNPAEVRTLLDGMAKAAGVQGVEYDPAKIFTFAKQARSAGGALSTDFLNTIAPSLIADMGPSAPGTALATLMSSVIGGTLSAGNTRQKLMAQRDLGLRGADNRLNPTDRDMLAQNPHLYAWDRIMPALTKSGVDVKNEGAVAEALNRLYTRTVADLFAKLISQKDQYQVTQQRLAKAPGLAGAAPLESKDPYVALAGVTSQITNSAATIAEPIVESILPAMSGFSAILSRFTEASKKDPGMSKQLGAIGGGAVMGGGIVGSIRALSAMWNGGGMAGGIAGLLRGGVRGGILGGIGGGLLSPILALRDAGEIKRPMTPTRFRMDAEISPDAWERSRRVRDEMLRDPEGARGRALSRIGTAPTPDAMAPESYGLSPASAAGAGQEAGSAAGQGVASGLAAQGPAVEAQAQGILDRIKALFGAGATVPVTLNTGSATAGSPAADGVPSARASGGSVHAGGVYAVNEYGTELFQPAEDGRIIDPRRKGASLGGASAGPTTFSAPITISVSGNADVQALASQVASELESTFSALMRGSHSDYGVETA
ncbi:hypothetical protein J2Y55_004568 [Bosea sp. BE125]|uniref:hypothetical protein n=1 Tax=Bosea sp. BE125 TaxID=2817909 RepID=UPI002856A5F8|nr:hypothetical protein [Bosea sp. BE125]MDR6873541.1 hypothetical protein [Bosea sp. BE125]